MAMDDIGTNGRTAPEIRKVMVQGSQRNGDGLPARAVPGPPTPNRDFEDEYELPVKAILQTIRQRIWLVVLTALIFVAGALVLGFIQTPIYQASIKMLVGQEQREDVASSNLGSDVQGLQQLTETVSQAVETRPVASAVIERLDLQESPEEFLQNLRVQQVSSTQFIEVSYTDPDPNRAKRIVDATGEEFSKKITTVSTSANAITATVWERSPVPDEPVLPNFLYYGLAAAAVGLTFGLILAFVTEYFDDSWRSPEEVERISGVPTFGVIPRFKISSGGERSKV
jgi:capsular polysaccharide biosynthesis protein